MRRLNGDDGATTILVALLLPVVLLGSAALALDLGSMYVERRQLQNGADSAALGVARDCASDPVACTQAIADASADSLAGANADQGPGNFGPASVSLLCGTIPGLNPCPADEQPAADTVTDTPYVKARATGWNAPLLGQFLGYGGQQMSADAVAALAERRGMVGARAPFALCAENTDNAPGYPTTGEPLLLFSGGTWTPNPAAIGQKYPLWSNGNPAEPNAATNKCGLGSSWKGWIDDELYTLPGWVDSGDGSAVGHLTYLTEAAPTCDINTNNGQISGDCRFVIPICTSLNLPLPKEGDLYCPMFGAFEFTDIKPVTSTEPNGWKTIYGEYLGPRQVDGGTWTSEEPEEGQPYIMVPRMVG